MLCQQETEKIVTLIIIIINIVYFFSIFKLIKHSLYTTCSVVPILGSTLSNIINYYIWMYGREHDIGMPQLQYDSIVVDLIIHSYMYTYNYVLEKVINYHI